MAEAAGEGGAGSEGAGVEGWGDGWGADTTTTGDVAGHSMGSAVASEVVASAAGDLGSGITLSAPPQNATMGLGTGITPGAVYDTGGASAVMGFGGNEGGMPEGGGEEAGPPMEKPKAPDVRDEALLGPADRLRRAAQRADAASVTLSDNEAYLLGGSSAKRKDARRVLLGS